MSYSDGYFSAVYRFPAVAIDTDAECGRIVGPAGKQGRVVAAGYVCTVEITIAASTISIGDGTDEDAYGTLAVPISAVGVDGNTYTEGADNIIDADSTVVLNCDGGATAGDGDVLVFINWY